MATHDIDDVKGAGGWQWAKLAEREIDGLRDKIKRLDNARMAAMHVLRATELGDPQERLDKAMEILESVEEPVIAPSP